MTFLCEIAKIESVDPSCHDRTILNFSVICNQFVTHEELNGIRLTVVFAYHAIYLSRLSMLMFPNWRQTARQRASKQQQFSLSLSLWQEHRSNFAPAIDCVYLQPRVSFCSTRNTGIACNVESAVTLEPCGARGCFDQPDTPGLPL